MSSMGEWLAGLVTGLSERSGWSAKTLAEKAYDLRFAVVSRPRNISAENSEVLRTYFHSSGGSWQALISEVMGVHCSAGGRLVKDDGGGAGEVR
jgi:hypothetical protein